MAEDRRTQERVSELEALMRSHLTEHTAFQVGLTANVEKIAKSMTEVAEVLRIYQNTRGTIATLKAFGVVVLWLAAVSTALAGMWAAIKYGLKS